MSLRLAKKVTALSVFNLFDWKAFYLLKINTFSFVQSVLGFDNLANKKLLAGQRSLAFLARRAIPGRIDNLENTKLHSLKSF